MPFSADGQDGWPLTRLVGNYIFRTVGPDALQKVADGEAKLTDPEYVEAASAVADLGAKGYFGPSVGSIDYTTAVNQFLTGKAAMFYMGSWASANFNDPAQNQIGADNIGFMPFPDVAGGAGAATSSRRTSASRSRCRRPTYDDDAKARGSSASPTNYGAQSLEDQGVITGFKVERPTSRICRR